MRIVIIEVILPTLLFLLFFYFNWNYFVLAIFALAFYHITWLYKTGNLLQWHDVESLDMIIHFSFFVAILSTAVMTWYIFEAVYFKEGEIVF
jgi:hypothetical protein